MKRRQALAFPLALAPVLSPVLSGGARADTLSIPVDADTKLRALLDLSAREWTAGDIDAFCSHYDDDAVFVSPSGLTRTRQAVLERYKKKYASREQMGALSFEILDVAAGPQAASVAMKWKLAFAKKPHAEGYSVIGLVKPPGAKAWRIKHDASM